MVHVSVRYEYKPCACPRLKRRYRYLPASEDIPAGKDRVGDDPESFYIDIAAGMAPEGDMIEGRRGKEVAVFFGS
jgi:hypothetical protein